MELDESDSDGGQDVDIGGPPPPTRDVKTKGLGTDTMERLKSLVSDLKIVHVVWTKCTNLRVVCVGPRTWH